jgi:hypothetical protein
MPRMETISPQFIRLAAEIAPKILRRVISAKAFDIFPTSQQFTCDSPKIGLENLYAFAPKRLACDPPMPQDDPVITAFDTLDRIQTSVVITSMFPRTAFE